jgi:FKBP-type peptidyl-prolyl cis-trans isomerase 2
MPKLDGHSIATMVFELDWESREAGHKERYLARQVNMWRDEFPEGIREALIGREKDEVVALDLAPGKAMPGYSEKEVFELSLQHFRAVKVEGRRVRPQFGRFYPRGFLCDVPGIYPEIPTPFRVIGLDETKLIADLNHPLALHPLHVEITIQDIARKGVEYGGVAFAWLEEVSADGPGMQARWQGKPTDFMSAHAFSRQNEEDDLTFHLKPRLVGHVDSQASAFVIEASAKHLSPGDKVLDLMSSVQSHLPLDMDLTVVGLGLNEEELAGNPRLSEFVVHDLNKRPFLPFSSGEYQTVVCHLSIEYLIDPMAIMYEVVRVLEPGGIFLVSFSNRWFPPKATSLWTEIHEFERVGLVLDYFLRTDAFEDLHTYSARNFWRPADDPHFFELPVSDPVYIVWGIKKS